MICLAYGEGEEGKERGEGEGSVTQHFDQDQLHNSAAANALQQLQRRRLGAAAFPIQGGIHLPWNKAEGPSVNQTREHQRWRSVDLG